MHVYKQQFQNSLYIKPLTARTYRAKMTKG